MGEERKKSQHETDQHRLWEYGFRQSSGGDRQPGIGAIKRIIADARERGSLIDATYGRRTRAVIITDSDHVILSAVQPETVANRLDDDDEEELEEDE